MSAPWSAEEDALVAREYPTRTAAEVAEDLRALSGRAVAPASVAKRASLAGVGKASGVRWSRHPEYDEMLREYAPGRGYAEVADEMERRFGVRPTPASLKNRLHTLGLRTGHNGGRFRSGHVPWSKGRTWEDFMTPESAERARQTQFRPGQLPHNARPVGVERTGADGRVYVHVRQRREERANDQWEPRARIAWERANGRALGPDEVVVHADGDPSNDEPSNLVAMTRAQHVVVETQGVPYADAATARTAAAIADLTSALRRARLRARGGGAS